MTKYSVEPPEFVPIIETPDNSYIDPPEISDAVDVRPEDSGKIVMDLNSFSLRFNWFKVMGRALYTSRTGIKKDNVWLRSLPKGYLVRKNQKGNPHITGHPNGHALSAVLFTPHLLWLDNKSSDRDCECTGCKSRPSARSVPLALSDTINECTIDSFKQVSSVTIGPSQGFYPELYTIPLPKIIKPDVALLSVKQERLLQAPVEQ